MQNAHQITCEWGAQGLTSHQAADVIIIIDVLSFSTAVDIVVSNDAFLYPYPSKDDSVIAYAQEKNAIIALSAHENGYTRSPSSLVNIPSNTKLILPSPNGSTLSFYAKANHILSGCLRNAAAVASAAMKLGKHIHLVPAGERWLDQSLRVAYEDFIGAGAIIYHLSGNKSEEARLAEALFLASQQQAFQNIFVLQSGQELIEWGLRKDIELACQYNCSQSVPILKQRFFTNLQFIT